MWFKKEKNMEEKPLAYWEEKSYMMVIPEKNTEDFMSGMFDRVSNIEGIKIIDQTPFKLKEHGSIKLIYQNEEYEVGFYPSGFSLPEVYLHKSFYFTQEEIEKLKDATSALTIYMKWHENPKKAFHLQLKLAVAFIPNLIGIVDESAEKVLPSRWVKMIASSKILPSSNDLYTVHIVYEKNGEVWLHTHGLCRCGQTELEILKSNQENYNNHYRLLSTYANYLIDQKESFDPREKGAYIGVLMNKNPIVVTCISWTKGLKEYKKISLGNLQDRQEGHNSKSSIIFLYKSEEDEKQKRLSKISEYDSLWGENPIFFVSNEETARMKSLAMERFHFVKDYKDNEIIIKIGLPIDQEGSFEHIWFKLIEFEGEKFKAKLLQEPYHVKDMHEGDEAWYTVSDVTDWMIHTPNYTITPENTYRLL